MTLHKLTEIIKKIFIGILIGIGIMFALTLIFNTTVLIKNSISPPRIKPPNQAYGDLPAVRFPINNLNHNFTYILNTVSGTLPDDFPDRLEVFQIIEKSPNLLSLNKAKEKASALGFTDLQGNILPETSLGEGIYQWSESTGINRKLKFNTVTSNFSLSSTYLSSLTVLSSQNLNDENNAIKTTQEFLNNIGLFPSDIDLAITQTNSSEANYNTFPKLYSIRNGALLPTTSLSSTNVIQVNLYQKNIEYELDSGVANAPKLKIKLPILYPNPPFSTMSFWIASGQDKAEVYAAEFTHHDISIPIDKQTATYPIKTVKTAFDELKNGKAYIGSYKESNKEITINDAYLAYYLGTDSVSYLMPIFVFVGSNDFIAYLSAITDEWIISN